MRVVKLFMQLGPLMTDFVPKYLGFGNISRDEIIKSYTFTFAKDIFGEGKTDVAICVVDGTYIYIEKISNNDF